MSLYQKYSYDPSFCAFHKMVNNLLKSCVGNNASHNQRFLLVSKYLHLSIVDYSAPQSEEDKSFYPLADLIVDGTINKDRVDEIAYEQIIVPTNLPEKRLEVLIDCMKRDYRKGAFPKVFKPFFKWKLGEIKLEEITLEQVHAMKQTADEMYEELEDKHPYAYDIRDNFIVDDPWQATRGFKEDKCMAAYLQYIDDNLAELQILVSQMRNAQC